jgi:hypothetical protein
MALTQEDPVGALRSFVWQDILNQDTEQEKVRTHLSIYWDTAAEMMSAPFGYYHELLVPCFQHQLNRTSLLLFLDQSDSFYSVLRRNQRRISRIKTSRYPDRRLYTHPSLFQAETPEISGTEFDLDDSTRRRPKRP